MILVVGATGSLGSEICRKLLARGDRVRALVRSTSSAERVDALRALGADIIVGDLRDAASLEAACRDAWAVIATATAIQSPQPTDSIDAVDRAGYCQLILAARAAHVQRMVYVSMSRNLDVPTPLEQAKRFVETAVHESGMEYAILRPSVFMDVWLNPALGFDYVNGHVRVCGDGTSPITWIALENVAEFAVRAVDAQARRNVVLELGGPASLSPLAVIGMFEAVTGRQFLVEHVPTLALELAWQEATEPIQRSFAGMMVAFTRGDVIDMRDTLSVFPVTLTSVESYAARVAGQQHGAPSVH